MKTLHSCFILVKMSQWSTSIRNKSYLSRELIATRQLPVDGEAFMDKYCLPLKSNKPLLVF